MYEIRELYAMCLGKYPGGPGTKCTRHQFHVDISSSPAKRQLV